eukprot:15043970-Alexandrium_andersonii.AAC.1
MGARPGAVLPSQGPRPRAPGGSAPTPPAARAGGWSSRRWWRRRAQGAWLPASTRPSTHAPPGQRARTRASNFQASLESEAALDRPRSSPEAVTC